MSATYLLLALRELLEHRHVVLPTRLSEQFDVPYLTITGGTTVTALQQTLVDSGDDHHGDEVEGSRVLLVYGYQASAAVSRWLHAGRPFAAAKTAALAASPDEAVPARSARPTVIVIAALPDDVARLQAAAVHVEELTPLPAADVADDLRAATTGLSSL